MRRLLGACDGTRTISEVSGESRLSEPMCLRLAEDAVRAGWARALATQGATSPQAAPDRQSALVTPAPQPAAAPVVPAADELQRLVSRMGIVFGEKRAEELLASAQKMVRGDSAQEILIALEFACTDEERSVVSRLSEAVARSA
ncbi:hypothetical protein ACFP81_01715 [Deinococcus lacus]|uniref:ANTAR domain-containing protein n=1 Tax=Deinococcus lacus TaxID=392561 RepID=A0ABW1Y9G4_9DEIO